MVGVGDLVKDVDGRREGIAGGGSRGELGGAFAGSAWGVGKSADGGGAVAAELGDLADIDGDLNPDRVEPRDLEGRRPAALFWPIWA